MSPEWIIATGGFVTTALGVLLTWAATKGRTTAEAKTALDKRIDERVTAELQRVYARLDELEGRESQRASAFARILRQIARQWPDAHGPDLDPADIAIVEDTVPPAWIRRQTPPKKE